MAGVLTAVVSAALLSAVAEPAAAANSSATVGAYRFAYDSGNVAAGATITDYVGSGTVLTIPGTVTIGAHNYSVTTIGDSAFESDSLTSVTIPTSVTTIGDWAFELNLLTSVIIPTSITTIGDGAFMDNSLTSVTIPTSVTTIGAEAFYSNSLTSVTIPTSVTTISAGAFAYNSLTSVTIPTSVTTISDYAFYYNRLTSVAIGASVTTIGFDAFSENSLTSVTIPTSVTTIGAGAFEYNLLTSVTIPTSVTTIGDYAFDLNRLTSVTIGDSVTTIGAGAFQLNSLTSVTIPASVTTIGDYAFFDNPLGSVVMLGPVPTTMGIRPFGVAGATTPLVTFFASYASSGYTTPTWNAGGQAYASSVAVVVLTDISGNPFATDIQWMVDQGITTGYADGTFRPAANVSRQAMAAFMYRFAGSPAFTPPVTSPFNDVATDSPFYKEITWMANAGISTGYADGGFHPMANVSRQAMAAFMYRFAGSPVFTPPGTSPFNDVATDSTFYAEVTWMANAAISTGYADGGFHPGANVSRQAMAAFMHRLYGVLHPV